MRKFQDLKAAVAFIIVFLVLPLAAAIIPSLIATHKPACTLQAVEVTKTEGDLTWTDVETMCL